MFAKATVMMAVAVTSMAPVALATVPFEFDCGQNKGGSYGYGGYGNNGDNNGGNNGGIIGGILDNIGDITSAFGGISSLAQNASALVRGTVDNTQKASDLFQHIHDIVCLTQSATNALNPTNAKRDVLSDSDQHNVCHAKSYIDLTHDNLLMNIEGKSGGLLDGFGGGALPTDLPSAVLGWLQSYIPFGDKVEQVAPICAGTHKTSSNVVSGVFNNVIGSLGGDLPVPL